MPNEVWDEITYPFWNSNGYMPIWLFVQQLIQVNIEET